MAACVWISVTYMSQDMAKHVCSPHSWGLGIGRFLTLTDQPWDWWVATVSVGEPSSNDTVEVDSTRHLIYTCTHIPVRAHVAQRPHTHSCAHTCMYQSKRKKRRTKRRKKKLGLFSHLEIQKQIFCC